MKIPEKELKAMIKEAVKKKIASLKESGSDFTAKREIVQSAMKASMDFEAEIKGLLNLVNPDDLDHGRQKMYYKIASGMQTQVVKAVAEAVKEFAKLPRNDDGNNKPNG
jgi:hypothetical protein